MNPDAMVGSPIDPQDLPTYNVPQATQHYDGDTLPVQGTTAKSKSKSKINPKVLSFLKALNK